MPVYNTKSQYLREAIDSILNQTFSDFEFIIINDGSTDPTVETTITSYIDPRIKYFKQKNIGLIGTLNRGLDLAKGEFIARMDSDDISLPTRFAEQLDFFEKNPDISILGTWFEVFQGTEDVCKHSTKVGLWELSIDNQLGHPTVMWRCADLEKYGLRYDPDYKAAEDYEFWSRAVRYVKIANLDKILLKYRKHNECVSEVMLELQKKNTERVRQTLLDFITPDSIQQKKIKKMQKMCQRIWLGVPLLKLKRENIYLFEIIPLVKMKKSKWWLFGIIPVLRK